MSEQARKTTLVETLEIANELFEKATLTRLEARDIQSGADPYIFRQGDKWHLLVQGNTNPTPFGHNGIHGYTIRSAERIEDLPHAPEIQIVISEQPEGLYQVWAAEIHFDKYMYVAISDGDNRTHRMHIYETENDVYGPWKYTAKLKIPEDKFWAIDLTLASLQEDQVQKHYAVWSGWEHPHDRESAPEDTVVAQNIYIAEFISPTEIGPRHLLMAPEGEWSTSVEKILEGPQSIYIDGNFYGLLITGNASWTTKYATKILKFIGGDPLVSSSWTLIDKPLFEDGHGAGHGMIIQEDDRMHYVGHRKSSPQHGWADRMVFFVSIDREKFDAYVNGEHPSFGLLVPASSDDNRDLNFDLSII